MPWLAHRLARVMSPLVSVALPAPAVSARTARGGLLGAILVVGLALGSPTAVFAVDTTAPTVPGTPTVNVAGGFNAVIVTWAASTDNVGVTSYTISRGGAAIAIVNGSATTFTDRAAAPGTLLSYTIKAADAAGNVSPASGPGTGTTGACASCTTATLRPASDVANTNFAPNSGAVHFNRLSETTADGDATYVYDSSTSAIGSDTVGLTAAPAGEIYSVVVHHSARQFVSSGSSGTMNTHVELLDGTTTIGTGATHNLPVTYTAYTDTFATSLPSGAAFRLKFVQDSASTTKRTSRLSYLDAVVTYNPDPTAPTVPTGLAGTPGQTTANLSWTASTDGIGVAGYKVYRNAVQVGSLLVGSTSFTDTGLTAGTTYAYTLAACDAAANCSAQTTGVNVTPDATPPTATIAINTGAAYTATSTVTLNVTSSDAGSGIASAQASNDGTTFTTVAGTSPSWTLSAGDGTKTVTYRVTDVAGNVTTVSDTIVLDATAPTATIAINAGAATTGSTTATLNVTNSDVTSGVATTQASLDNAIWSTVTGTSPTFSLVPTVLSFPGVSGNPPGGGALSNLLTPVFQVTAGTPVTVTLTTALSDGGNLGLGCTNNNFFGSATLGVHTWTPTGSGTVSCRAYSWSNNTFRPALTGAGTLSYTPVDGVATVYYRVTDNAGSTTTVSDTIVLATAPPPAPGAPDLDTASDHGPVEVQKITTRIRPDSDVALTGPWTLSSGTTGWNLVDDGVLDQTDYVRMASSPPGTFIVGFTAPSLAPTDIVTRVTFGPNAGGTGNGYWVVRNPATGTLYPLTTYPGETPGPLTVRPWDGHPWTAADVADLQYGLVITSNGNLYIYRLYAEVEYTTFTEGGAPTALHTEIANTGVATGATLRLNDAPFNVAPETVLKVTMTYTVVGDPTAKLWFTCDNRAANYNADDIPDTNQTNYVKSWAIGTAVLTNCNLDLYAGGTSATLTSGLIAWQGDVVVTDAVTSPHIFDNVTNDDTPGFSGTNGIIASSVDLYDGTTLVGTDPSVSDGTWAITAAHLDDGVHTITARAVSAAGTSPSSAGLSVTIDTVAPVAPSTPDLDGRADTGASNTDNITDVHSPNYPNVINPVTTGHMVNESDWISPTLYGNAATTPYVSWTFTWAGYSGRLTAGLLCDNGANVVAADPAPSGATFTANWPAGASSCHLYTWVGGFGAGPYDVTGGTYTYHDTAVVNSFAFLGSGPTDAASVTLFEGPTVIGADNVPLPGTSYAASPAADMTTGSHTLSVRANDLAGNVSPPPTGLTVILVDHLPALRASAPTTSVVGATTYVSVATVDEIGEPITGLVGSTITISSDDPGAVYPIGTTYQLTASNGEVGRTFKVLFSTPGIHSVTVSAPGVTSSTYQIDVAPAALRAAAPATVYQNIPFRLAVMPRIGSKTSGPVNKAYGARVIFSSSDAAATFGQEVNASKQYTFICNCDGAHMFATKLIALGQQTLTVTDQFGTTDTITVNVVPAPGGGISPISRIDALQWPQGNSFDYYITAANPYELLYVYDSCGLSNKPLSESGIGIVTGTRSSGGGSGAGLMTMAAEPANPFNLGVLPPILNTAQYDQGTVTFQVEAGLCGAGGFGENWTYTFVYTDGSGHLFSMNTTGSPGGPPWRVFTDIPGNANFVQQGPDSPIISWSIVSRGGGGSSTFTDPTTGALVQYSPNAISARFITRAPMQVYRFQVVTDSLGTVDFGAAMQMRRLPSETTTVTLHDSPFMWMAGCAGYRTNTAGHIYIAGPDGHRGALSGGLGFLGPTTEPPPPTWPCLPGTQGQPDPPDPNDPLRDALDRLGLDDALGFADSVNELTHMTMGDPVDAFSGGQTGDAVDFSLGGRTPFLAFSRRYRSELAELAAKGKTPESLVYSTLGRGWASSLDWKLAIAVGGATITVRGDDGGAYQFRRRDDGTYGGPAGLRMTLTAAGGGYLLERPAGDGYRFDAAGRLLAIRDVQAHEMTIAYDMDGYVDSFTDAAGRTADVTVNGAGHITSIVLPDGRFVAYAYDPNGFLSSVRMLDGTSMTYVADRRGRVIQIKDPDGNVVLANEYDGRGRVVTQTDALGNASHFAYDRALNISTLAFGPRGDLSITCFNPDGTTAASLDPEDGRRDYTYDHNGQTIAAIDEVGARTSYAYDTGGNPTRVKDAKGRAVVTTYDGKGRPMSATGTDGATLTTTYDPVTGGPATITRTKGADSLVVATYTYNALGLPEQISEPGGATTTLLYDTRGYLRSTTDAEGRETTFVTDARGFVTSSVDPLGNAPGGVPADHTTTTTYDDLGRVLIVTDPLDNVTTNTYDDVGRLETTETPLGATTVNTYDTKGQLRTTTRDLTGSTTATTTYEYDEAGNIAAVIDPENRRTEFTYDLLGRLIKTHDAASKDWTSAYDPAGRVIRRTDPTGRAASTSYDSIGRIATTTDAAGKTTTYGYDDAGRLQTVTDPLTHATTYGYDWMGRQNAVTNARQETGSVVFDDAGNVESVTNARNKTTAFEYDQTHRLTKVTEPGGIETVYTYDDAGRLETRTNDRTAVERYEYDAVGRPTKLVDPLGNDWVTSYDADGRVDTTIDANGQTVDYTFDLGGRVLSLDPDVGATISFAYDDSGRRESMTDGAGTTTYGYDPLGRLTSSARAGRTTTYGYDDAGRPSTVGYPAAGGSVGYGYDPAGRLQTITDWASRTTTYGYDDASRVTSISRPGSLATTIGYDELNRPLNVATTRNATPVLTQTYSYDANGNLATYGDDAGLATFGYDDLDRLTSAQFPASQSYTYGYDAVGNLTSAVSPTGTWTYTHDLADRITSTGPAGTATSSSTRSPSTDNAGWTVPPPPPIAYALDDAVYATATPAKNGTTTMRVGTFGFGSIPANATITNVTVSVDWKVSNSTSPSTLGSQVYVNNVARGNELVNTAKPTSDTPQTYSVTGLTRADLVDGALEVQVRASRGNSNTAFTASLDLVSIKVDYTTPVAPAAPVYDDNGAMLTDGSYGNRTFSYDGFGRLTAVGGPTSASYTLDGAGNRLAQTVGGVTAGFDLDLRQANPTILADGTRRYLPGDPAAGYEQAGVWYSALADQAGSPHSTISHTGVQGPITRYDPYGAARPGSTITAGIGYGGEWADATGLVNLRARAYAPSFGRFTSRDGFGGLLPSPQTANRYSYALNGPYRYGDPSGHFVNALYENGPMLLSLGVQTLPGIGDAYSFLTGSIGFDPIAGISLSTSERALAIGSALVIGGGFHLLSHLADDVADASRLGRAGEDLATEGANAARGAREGVAAEAARADQMTLFIQTPKGLAKQSTTPAAMAARDGVLGGARLYKGARSGRSLPAGESQYFALEHPSSAGFAERYGVPPENIPFEEVYVGTLRPGAPFVTRPAPGVDTNIGGGIEVVLNPGDFIEELR